jgi:hypothetical protein
MEPQRIVILCCCPDEYCWLGTKPGPGIGPYTRMYSTYIPRKGSYGDVSDFKEGVQNRYIKTKKFLRQGRKLLSLMPIPLGLITSVPKGVGIVRETHRTTHLHTHNTHTWDVFNKRRQQEFMSVSIIPL